MADMNLLSTLGGAAAKASVILALAGAVTLIWRSASAASRHLVWTLGVSAALAVPAIVLLIERFDAPKIEIEAWRPTPAPTKVVEDLYPIPDKSASTVPIVMSTPRVKADIELTEAPIVESEPGAIVEATPAARKSIDWMILILPVYLAGVFLSLLPLAVAQIRVRRLARRASVANRRWNLILENTPSISRHSNRVRILESADAAMPMTWGVFRPTLLVPSSGEKWADWQCRNILLHELAHVERRDCATQLIAQAACAIYWFSPMTWIAAHRMRVERELACDDRVINAGSRASDYASNLLDVARSLRAPSMTSSTAIAMARPSQLSGRLLAVLDKHRNRRTVSRGVAACTSFAAMAIALPLASLTPASSATAASLEAPAPVAAPSAGETPTVSSAQAAAMTTFAGAPVAIVKAAQLPAISILTANAEEHVKMTPAAAPSLPAVLAPQQDGCWEAKDGSVNVSINSNDKNKDRQSYTVKYSHDDCSLELRAEGDFRLRADLSDVESIGRDGWLRIEERQGRSSKRIEIRRADNGEMERRYYVNGDRANYDESARVWLARTLLGVERRTAFAADTRVPQLYRSGGLRGVLSEISAMQSAYPKSKYYSTLFDMGISLDTNTLNSIVRQVSTDLSSSDYYMAEVLGRFGSQPAADENTWRSFADAAGRMKSDYYRSQTLKKVLSKGRLSSSTVNLLLKNASGMKSDYYLTDLLKEVSDKYALNNDTRQYYLEALRSIESDYYRSELLKAMRPDGQWDPKATAYVLDAVADIKSDYYKSESLKSLASAKAVNNWPSYFNAAVTIGSDYYKKETLTAALKQSPLTREIVAGVLGVAPRIKSDSEMAEVLSAVARNYNLDQGLRDAYEKAVDAMDSDYYRGAALSALRRSVSR